MGDLGLRAPPDHRVAGEDYGDGSEREGGDAAPGPWRRVAVHGPEKAGQRLTGDRQLDHPDREQRLAEDAEQQQPEIDLASHRSDSIRSGPVRARPVLRQGAGFVNSAFCYALFGFDRQVRSRSLYLVDSRRAGQVARSGW